MRASHREIRKRIMDRMSKISDREFFTSRAYRGYLTDITESATKKYRRPIRVMLFDASEDPTVAYTDYSGIYINVCNHITNFWTVSISSRNSAQRYGAKDPNGDSLTVSPISATPSD